MITAPINEVLNDITEAIKTTISSVIFSKGKYSATTPPFIIRVQATATDQKIFMKPTKDARGKTANAKPSVLDEESINPAIAELQAARALVSVWKTAHTTPHDLGDPRLRVYESSLGYAILQICGLVKSPHTDPNTERYAPIRNQICQLEHGDVPTPKEKADLTKLMNILRSDTLQRANVVLCTLSASGQPTIYDSYQSNIIYVDEASKASESDT